MDDEEKGRFDAKEAAKKAIAYVRELFSDEKITNLGLEEIDRRGATWLITVGFSRPWNDQRTLAETLKESSFAGQFDVRLFPPARDYKVVVVDAKNGDVLKVRMRAA